MTQRKVFFSLILIISICILLIFLVYGFGSCFIFKIINFSGFVMGRSEEKTILFLYGNLCSVCPSGEYIYSLKDDEAIVLVVPSQFTEYDIENLRNIYSLKGHIVKGGFKARVFLKLLSKCFKIAEKEGNFKVKFKGKRVVNIEKF